MVPATVVRTASPAPLVTVPEHADPLVSFVSVTYGTGPIVVDAIAAIVASLAGSGIAYEVVVVDNSHPVVPARTSTELLLSTHGVLLVAAGRNLGFGGGCELGAFHARGDVLAFTNPDLIVESGWLEPLLAHLDEPGVSIVAPVLRDPDGSVQEAGSVLLADGSTRPIVSLGDRAEVDYASAACWLMRRTEHERLGGFDPDFHPAYYEDVELALRARRHGGRTLVDPNVGVVHHRGSSTYDRGVVSDTTRQRDLLLQRAPWIRWTQPAPEAR